MNFLDAVKHVFQNFANFKGRARRSEYWYFMLFNIIIWIGFSIPLSVLSEERVYNPSTGFYDGLSGSFKIVLGFFVFYLLASLIPFFAVLWRRFHDIGKSGLWFLFAFWLVPIPFDLLYAILHIRIILALGFAIEWFIIIFWLTRDSQPGDNKYGPNPKENETEYTQ